MAGEVNEKQIQHLINTLKTSDPEQYAGLSDAEILSIYNQLLNDVSLSSDDKISLIRPQCMNVDIGLAVEYTGSLSQKDIPLSEQESEKVLTLLKTKVNNVTLETEKVKEDNGPIGKVWSWLKNTALLDWCTDGTDDIKKAQAEDLRAIESKDAKLAFKELTGVDFSRENWGKFKNGEILTKSEQALQGYKEGQEMAMDVAADMISGIAAVGIYGAALAAATFTGGLSIAAGFAAAGVSAAAIKTTVKSVDSLIAGREYDMKDVAYDMATGSVSGLLAPFTGGTGGAVGKTIAVKAFGIQAFKQMGKEAVAETAEATAKNAFKRGLINPTGYEYVAQGATRINFSWRKGFSVTNLSKYGLKQFGKEVTATGAEMATDGAISGMLDTGFRTGYEQIERGEELDFCKIAAASVQGFVGGFVAAPLIGGGMKVASS